MAVFPSTDVRVTVAESLNGDLGKGSEWCDLWEMIWFQNDFWEASSLGFYREASQRLSILRKSWRVFHDRLILGRCFRSFVLPNLEYWYAVWGLTTDTHFRLLDRVVSGACSLTGGMFECDVAHRRSVEVLCMMSKIWCCPMRPLYGALHVPYVQLRVTRGASFAHRFIYAPPRCSTSQYRRTFVPSLTVSVERSWWPYIRWCWTGRI